MKKFVFALVCALGFVAFANAQTASERIVQFDKTSSKPGYSIIFNNSVKEVTEAVKGRMAKETKSKPSSVKGAKGVLKYAQVSSSDICTQTCDLYLKIEGNATATTVTAFVSKGYDNFISSSNDPETASLLKSFLESLSKDVFSVNQNNQITVQEKVWQKSEDAYKKAVSTKEKLEKQLEAITQDIQKFDAERQNQQKALEALKAKTF